MKIKFERETLLPAFHHAATVSPSRSPKEILQSVKIEAEGDSATIIATDMEIGMRVSVSGIEVLEAGAAVLPVDRFGMILRESSDEQLLLEASTAGATVKGSRSEFKLPGRDADEFPEVAAFGEEKYHEIPARLLKELIRRTLFSTDPESTRYALGGVLLEMEETRIIAVGTDGRRLAKMEGPAQSVGGHVTGDSMVIVPSRSMQLVERVLSDSDAEVKLAARGNDVILQTPRLSLYTRLVEGRFPKWRDVLPQRSNAIRLDLLVGPVHAAVRQAAVVTDNESRGLDFTFADGTLTLTASTANIGESHVELPIPYDGEKLTVTLDNRFVAEFLKVLEAEKTFTLEVTDAETAALFRTDDGYAYVVMPLSRER